MASFSASTQKSASPCHGPRTSGGPWLDVRDPPRQDHAGVPVRDRHQGERGMSRHRSEAMPSAATHRQICDVHTPTLLAGPHAARASQIGVSLVSLRRPAGIGLLVDRHQTHQAHKPTYALFVHLVAVFGLARPHWGHGPCNCAGARSSDGRQGKACRGTARRSTAVSHVAATGSRSMANARFWSVSPCGIW